jgi:hypothetical protein
MTTVAPRPAQPKYDLDEQEERREIMRRSQHSNRLAGIEPNPEHDYIREAIIRGDVDGDGAIAMIRAHHGILDKEEIKRRLAAGEKVKGY